MSVDFGTFEEVFQPTRVVEQTKRPFSLLGKGFPVEWLSPIYFDVISSISEC